MSKFKSFAQLLGVIILLITVAGCGGQQQVTGIPPAQATIWALNTQIALQQTFSAMTLTAIANEKSASPNANADQNGQSSTVLTVGEPSGLATPDPSLTMPVNPSIPAGSPTVACSVKASKVDLRIGPDVRFPGGGQYIAGTTCTISARYYNWFYVQMADGQRGWLYLDWLTIPDTSGLSAIPYLTVPFDWKWARECKKYCR